MTLPKSEPGSEPPKRDVYVGAAVTATNFGVAAARLALLPARALGRTNVVRRQVDELAAAGNEATAHALDRVVAAVDDAFSSAEARNALDRVLEDDALRARILEQLQRALRSPEGQQLLEEVVASPAVRNALTNETTAAVDDFATRVRAHLAAADDDVERRIGRVPDRSQPTSERYGGVASRAVAFSADALLANGLYLVGAGLVALVASLAGGLRPEWLAASIAAVGWIAVVIGYFVGFWTLAGQTPGMLLVRQRVSTESGEQIGVGRALVRLLVLILSIIPFFAGAIPMLFDSRRRGLWDLAAGTVVTLEGD